ncbi:hypothetical protein SAMN05660964_03256 [Thiothrix caldifontis]|uniref:Uncharacterized protein n=1 Tax=Thiothrix caldifontis TaxID=525918 RepID=A0A1H4G5N3_9GAMM|nr:hypothetical protein [Thiothrix caldifontis]SEB04012.1 hypothetical protein SAMN05660964_03256 [Thiothrix caldifontis]
MQFPDIHLIRLARHTETLLPLSIATQDISFDLTDEASMITALQSLPDNAEIDWVFIATGWLHDNDTQPEKTWLNLYADHLLRSFTLNTVSPMQTRQLSDSGQLFDFMGLPFAP